MRDIRKRSVIAGVAVVVVAALLVSIFLIWTGTIELPGTVDAEEMQAIEGDYYIEKQDGMFLNMADGEATTTMTGTYQMKESDEGMIAALKPDDSSEFIDYTIDTQNGTTNLEYMDDEGLHLTYKSGTDGLNSTDTENFEGTYNNEGASECQFIFYKNGTYEEVIVQEYDIGRDGILTMTGSVGKSSYRYERSANSFTLNNDSGDLIIEWIRYAK